MRSPVPSLSGSPTGPRGPGRTRVSRPSTRTCRSRPASPVTLAISNPSCPAEIPLTTARVLVEGHRRGLAHHDDLRGLAGVDDVQQTVSVDVVGAEGGDAVRDGDVRPVVPPAGSDLVDLEVALDLGVRPGRVALDVDLDAALPVVHDREVRVPSPSKSADSAGPQSSSTTMYRGSSKPKYRPRSVAGWASAEPARASGAGAAASDAGDVRHMISSRLVVPVRGMNSHTLPARPTPAFHTGSPTARASSKRHSATIKSTNPRVCHANPQQITQERPNRHETTTNTRRHPRPPLALAPAVERGRRRA